MEPIGPPYTPAQLNRDALGRLLGSGYASGFTCEFTSQDWSMAREICSPRTNGVIGPIKISTADKHLRYECRYSARIKIAGNLELTRLTEGGLARLLYELAWFITKPS